MTVVVLDWTGSTSFVAAVQTGFGTFVTVYLVKSQWPPAAIGFVLTIGTISTLISQMPAGAIIDSIRDKRRAVLAGMIGVDVAAWLLSAGVMGIAGSHLPPVSVFLVAAVLVPPALISLSLIGAGYGSQPAAEPRQEDIRITWEGMKSLFLDRRLVIFAAGVVLFFAASAAM